MKDKRQRVALAWPYGLAAESALYAYLVNAAAAAAQAAHLSHQQHHYTGAFPSPPGLQLHQSPHQSQLPSVHHLAAPPAAALLHQHQQHFKPTLNQTSMTPGNSPTMSPAVSSDVERFPVSPLHTGYPVSEMFSALHQRGGSLPQNGIHAAVAASACQQAFAGTPSSTSSTINGGAIHLPFPVRCGLPVISSSGTDSAILSTTDRLIEADEHSSNEVDDADTRPRSPDANRSPSSEKATSSFPLSMTMSHSKASSRRVQCGLFQPYKTDD